MFEGRISRCQPCFAVEEMVYRNRLTFVMGEVLELAGETRRPVAREADRLAGLLPRRAHESALITA